MARRVQLFLILFCWVFLCSCTTYPMTPVQPPPEKEQPDLSCAYFYFLWGTHAEFNEQYDEALGTFSKVLMREPANALARINVGYICLKKGIFGEAIEHLSRAIRLDNDRKATL